MATKEEKYWDNRYRLGGTSGKGSIGEHRTWKWNIITNILPTVNHVIDVGCGDLSFWEGRDCQEYTGIDISSTIVEQNRTIRPGWEFIISPAEKRIEGLHRECVFCFDVLFHIMEQANYTSILQNLCYYSTRYIFVYNWIRNPWTRNKRKSATNLCRLIFTFHIKEAVFVLKTIVSNSDTDGKYQYFRPLDKYMYIFISNGFRLISTKECFDGVGLMYIFQKTGTY